MAYVNQLRAAIRHGMLPAYKALTKDEGSSDEVKRQTFEKILNLCSEVWQASCISAGALGGMSTRGAVMEVATLFDALQPPLLYGSYATAYSDAVANGTMSHLPIIRLVDEALLKVKCMGVVKQEDGPADALMRLVLLPMERMAAYDSYCQRLSFLTYKGGLASSELARASEQWVTLSEALKIALAEVSVSVRCTQSIDPPVRALYLPLRSWAGVRMPATVAHAIAPQAEPFETNPVPTLESKKPHTSTPHPFWVAIYTDTTLRIV